MPSLALRLEEPQRCRSVKDSSYIPGDRRRWPDRNDTAASRRCAQAIASATLSNSPAARRSPAGHAHPASGSATGRAKLVAGAAVATYARPSGGAALARVADAGR
jgi:hypothetical protein